MDDSKPLPVIFANRVIRQMVLNQAGPDLVDADYQVIRLVFRQLGGLWEPVFHGDMVPTRLLVLVVSNWVRMYAKSRAEPVLIA